MKLFCVSSTIDNFIEGEEYHAVYNGIVYRVVDESGAESIADYDPDSGYIVAEFFNDDLVELSSEHHSPDSGIAKTYQGA